MLAKLFALSSRSCCLVGDDSLVSCKPRMVSLCEQTKSASVLCFVEELRSQTFQLICIIRRRACRHKWSNTFTPHSIPDRAYDARNHQHPQI